MSYWSDNEQNVFIYDTAYCDVQLQKFISTFAFKSWNSSFWTSFRNPGSLKQIKAIKSHSVYTLQKNILYYLSGCTKIDRDTSGFVIKREPRLKCGITVYHMAHLHLVLPLNFSHRLRTFKNSWEIKINSWVTWRTEWSHSRPTPATQILPSPRWKKRCLRRSSIHH